MLTQLPLAAAHPASFIYLIIAFIFIALVFDFLRLP